MRCWYPTQAPSDATVASLQDAVFTTVPSGRTFYHRVRKGETLASIAARYDVSTQELKGWNAGVAVKLTPGQRLRVVSDAGPVAAKKIQARPQDPGCWRAKSVLARQRRGSEACLRAARRQPRRAPTTPRLPDACPKQNRRHLRVACFGGHRSPATAMRREA